jgi:hypothetical protein
VQGLDRASQGLTVADAQRVRLDLRAGAVALRLGTMQAPLLEAGGAHVSGTVVMARLASLPPQLHRVKVPVGTWHTVELTVPRAGCRPPVKAYTDVAVTLTAPSVQLTAGLDPAFAALAHCTRRIIPPSRVGGDATVLPADPQDSALAWWDRMRYQWRGRLRVLLADASIAVAPTHSPDIVAGAPRLLLRAKSLDVLSEPDVQLALALDTAHAALLLSPHERRSRPDATPLRVPLASLSNLAVSCTLALELPNGREPAQHHVFPPVLLGQRLLSEGVQGPVDVGAEIAAQSVSINVAISIRSGALQGLVRCCAQSPRPSLVPLQGRACGSALVAARSSRPQE